MSLSIPLSNIDNISTENTPIFSQCKMYDVNFTDVLLSGQRPNTTWPTKKCDNGWIFNYTNVPYESIAAEVIFPYIFKISKRNIFNLNREFIKLISNFYEIYNFVSFASSLNGFVTKPIYQRRRNLHFSLAVLLVVLSLDTLAITMADYQLL